MLSLYQIEDLRDYLTKLTEDISEAIRTKPVKRKSKGLGSFEAPVNASGNLAASVDFEIGDNRITITALDYINKLIFGQPPGENPVLSDIENWLAIKGLNYSPYSVAHSIRTYGSSIYQEFKGQESNLLEDFIRGNEVNPAILEAMFEAVNEHSIDNITNQLLEQLREAA